MNIKILEVINDECAHPVEYASPVKNGGMLEAARTALKELGIDESRSENRIDEIVGELRRGNVYWLEETHCFCVVDLEI